MAMEPQHSFEGYRLLVENAPVMLWRAGVDGRCDYFNAAWLRFTGRTLAQEVGDGWAAGVHADDLPHVLAVYGQHVARRTPFELEYRLRRHDGTHRWVLDCGIPYEDASGTFTGFVGCCVDVEERRNAIAAKAAFLCAMAHELRTPLTSTWNYLDVVRRRLEDGRPIAPDVVRRAMRQIESFGRLVNQLGETARVEAGRPLALAVHECDLAALVRQAVELQRDGLTAEDATIPDGRVSLAVAPGHYTVRVDRARLSQVLLHLLDNAVKYSPEGGHVRVELAVMDGAVRLTVADAGIGIPAGEVDRLGERYFRASNAPTDHYAGLGLGLALSREIVEAHRGRLDIASRVGEGTIVTLELPLDGGSGAHA